MEKGSRPGEMPGRYRPRLLSILAALVLVVSLLTAGPDAVRLGPKNLTPAVTTLSSQLPSTNTAVTTGWTNAGNGYSDNNSYATAAPAQNAIIDSRFQGFNLTSIPSTANITSVVLRARYFVSSSSGAPKLLLQASLSGTDYPATAGSFTSKPTTETVVTLDVTSYRAWTRADLVDATFGIRVGATRTTSTAETFSLDDVEVDVTYANQSTLNQSAYRWFQGSTAGAFGTGGNVDGDGLNDSSQVYSDGTYVWIVGRIGFSSTSWTYEKRNASDGALVSGYGTGGVVTAATTTNAVNGMISDGTYSYAIGSNDTPDAYIEKRNLSDGALVSGFGTSGAVTSASSSSTGVAIDMDSTYLYEVYSDSSVYKIEKRLKSTGALDTTFGTSGIVTTSLAIGANTNHLRIDSTYLYFGEDSSGSGKMEKRLLTTGALDTSFGTSGVLSIANPIRSFEVTNGKIYSAEASLNSTWSFVRRLTTTGALDTSWTGGTGSIAPTASGSSTFSLDGVETDGTWIYYFGSDNNATQGRIDQISLDGATQYSSTFDLAANDGDIHALFPAANGVYVTGRNQSLQGRFWKRNVVGLTPVTGYEVTSLAAQDTGYTTLAATNLRLRTLLSVTTDDMTTSGYTFKLQFAPLSGTCAASTYSDVDTVSGAIRYKDNTGLTGGSSLVGLTSANDPVYSAQTNVAQYYMESNNFTPRAQTPSGQSALWDFAIDASNGVAGTTYCFRIVTSTGTTLNTYTQYPQLTMQSSTTLNQASYRFFANVNGAGDQVPLAAQDTTHTLASIANPVRLRTNIAVTGGTLAAGQSYKLQFGTKSGTCAASTFADVASGSGAIRYYDNTNLTGASAYASDSDDPVYSAQTNIGQTYVESNNFSTTNSTAAGQAAIWDFALDPSNAPASTTYCFRIVTSAGAALNTYTTYPEFTTHATNTVPAAPTSLQQYKSDGTTVLSWGGWTDESTVILSATVTDPDNDQVMLCAENTSTLTSPASPALCGSLVNSGQTATITVTGLTSNTVYRWQVKAKDANGAYSATYTQFHSGTLAYESDQVNPNPTSNVYDGTVAATDAAYNSGALDTLSANWAAASDNGSGIAKYQYRIGTTQGGFDIRDWTDNVSTSVTATGLALRTSVTYYFTIRTVDNVNRIGAEAYSNGQLVAPTLSFSVGSTSLTFANLKLSNSYTDSQATTITTSTNGYGGYVVRAYAQSNPTSGSNTISGFNGGTYAAPDAWNGADRGFGYTSSDTDIQGSNLFQAATCPGGSTMTAPGCFAPYSLSAPGQIVADHPSGVSGTPISGEVFTITSRFTVSSSQPAGQYTNTLVFSAIPTF